MSDESSRIDELFVAATFQADRIKQAAINLAGWTTTWLRNHRSRGTQDVAAREFAEGALSLAGVLIWNETPFPPGPMSRATAGGALAYDVIRSMPWAFEAAVSIGIRPEYTLDECRELARSHASIQLAKDCLEISRLIPDYFDGPNGPKRRDAARLAWCAFHGLQDQTPRSRPDAVFSAQPVPDRPESNAPPASGSNAIDFHDLAERLRKAGKPTPAKLVEYMADKTQATPDDIAARVHGVNCVSIDAIRKNVGRTNGFLVEIGSRLSFRVASDRVFREISPE